jgi:peroxiredoxin Q/BCP
MAFVGTDAPAFRLQDENGNWRELRELHKGGTLMLVFYPGDFTIVCTKQLCAYQESFSAFEKLGVQIAGISPNAPASHQEFKQRFGFSFPLLSDPDKEVTKRYGITSLFMFGGTSRANIVVNRDGKIVYRHVEPTTLTHRKPAELIASLAQLKHKKAL